jgi:hypothetical protein
MIWKWVTYLDNEAGCLGRSIHLGSARNGVCRRGRRAYDRTYGLVIGVLSFDLSHKGKGTLTAEADEVVVTFLVWDRFAFLFVIVTAKPEGVYQHELRCTPTTVEPSGNTWMVEDSRDGQLGEVACLPSL